MPGTLNDFLLAEEQRLQANDAAGRFTLYEGAGQNPQASADNYNVGKKLNLPTEIVEGDPANFKRLAKVQDMNRAMADTPGLRTFAQSRPANAAMVGDQYEPLGLVERTARNLAAGLGADFIGSGVSGIGHSLDAVQRRLVSGFSRMVLPTPMAGGEATPESLAGPLIGDAWRDFGKTTKDYWNDGAPKAGTQTFGDQVVRGLGQLAGQLPLSLTPLGVPLMFGQGVDQQADKIAQDKGAAGASQAEKDFEMLTGGAITAATEWLSSKIILSPPKTLALKNRMFSYALKVAEGAASEGIQEFSENLLQDVAHIAFTNSSAEVGWGDAGEAAGVGATVGAIASSIVQAAFHIRARRQQQAFQNLNDAAKVQELRTRSPEAYQEFADHVAQHMANTTEGAIEHVYVDAKVFNQVLTEAGVDPAKVAESVPGIGAQLAQATATGGDVVVPIGEWVGKVAGTEIGDMLLPHMRASEDAMSVTELQQAQKMQDDLQAQADQILQEKQRDEGFVQSAHEVEKTIFDQLVAAKPEFGNAVHRAYATFVRDFYVTAAAEQGIQPMDFYRLKPYQVTGSGQGVLNQAAKRLDGPLSKLAETVAGNPKENAYFVELGRVDSSVAEKIHTATGINTDGARVISYGSDVLSDTRDHPNLTAADWDMAASLLTDAAAMARSHEQKGAQGERFNAIKPLGNGESLAAVFEVLDSNRHGRRLVLKNFFKDNTAGVENWFRSGSRDKLDSSFMLAGGDPRFPNNADGAKADPLEPGSILHQNVGAGDTANRGGFDPTKLTTILHEKADYSTFLHETGHLFLQITTELAAQPDASPRIKADVDTLLQWFAIEGDTPEARLTRWQAMSIDEQRPHHEAWAYNTEIYLFEGKAPNVKLQSLFSRFSDWLKRAYISIRDELNTAYKQENGVDLPILTGEVRQVMDRMLASEEQIKAAEQVRGMLPLFETQAQSGMDEAEWAAYQEMNHETRQAAVESLQGASLRQMKWLSNARGRLLKEMQKESADTRKAMRKEVEAEVSRQPIYLAMRWLTRGEALDAEGNEIKAQAGHRLSIAALQAMYPEGALGQRPDWKKLGYGKYGMLAEEGLHPDMVAEMFDGFTSGDDLVRQLLEADKFSAVVEAMTDKRMLEEHGDMSDPDAIARKVEEALHNEARARFVAVELRHLTKATQPVRVMLEAARQVAQNVINGKAVKDIKPRQYAVAEGRAAREAAAAMKKGESEAAGRAKQNQLLQNQLAREAITAQQEITKAIEFFKKVFVADGRIAKTRDMDTVNAARAILANYGVGRTDGSAIEYLDKIKAYDPEGYAEIESMITAHKQAAKPLNQLTLDEFRAVRDQVAMLWHLSRRSRQIEIDGQKVDRDVAVAELTERIRQIGLPAERPGYDRAMSDWDKRKIKLMGIRAAMRRTESWIDAMDGGNPDGPFRRYLWTPISEAVSTYRLAKQDYLQQYLDLVKAVEQDLTGAKIAAPEIGYTFKNKAELLHALLHTGNDSNKRKLLLGRRWAGENADGSVDTSRWEAFLQRLHHEGQLGKQHYDFAQGVWDLLEKMKPGAQKAHHDMYGVYFAEITANTLTTPFGVYRGGYVPAVADPFVVTDQAVRNEKETQATDNSYMFPTTGRGFTKGRVDYNVPLALDLGFLPSHIDKVLRFTHVEPRIKDVAKIVKTSKSFAKTMDALDPTIRGDMLVPWLQRTAQQLIATPGKGWGGKGADEFWRAIRTRTGMQMMVANVTNALQQFTGLSIAALKVKPSLLRNALWQYTRAPADTAGMVAEKSEYMRTRMSNQQFEIQKTIDDLLLNPSQYEKLRDFTHKHGYFLQSAFQNTVDTITWIGAYNQGFERSGDEKAAVREADAAVRLTQGSFAPEDSSRYETGTPFVRAFTMFYSYFNMQANLLGTEFTKVARELGVRKGAGQLLYIYALGFMVPAVLSEMLVQAAGGFDAGDDDEYDLWDAMRLFFGSQARGVLAMVPFFGQVATAAVNASNSKPYDDRMSTSPAVSAIEASVRAPLEVYKAIAEDGSWKKAVRDSLTALGMITGLPLGQLGKPLGYAADVAQGKVDPESGLDVARGLLSGKDVNRRQD